MGTARSKGGTRHLGRFVFLPFMTTGAGVGPIGGWFGPGPDRGLALLFTVAGLVGLGVTLLAMRTRSYRLLSRHTATTSSDPEVSPVSA